MKTVIGQKKIYNFQIFRHNITYFYPANPVKSVSTMFALLRVV